MDYNRYKLIKARLSEGLEVPYAEWLVYKDYETKYRTEIPAPKTVSMTTSVSYTHLTLPTKA